MNMENLTLTIIELVISLVVEGVILGLIFQGITNKSEDKMQSNLKQEMNTIEQQTKFQFEQLQNEIRNAKADIISEVKEAGSKGAQKNDQQNI
jgi:uncharacterized membrane-anchored protein YhcB (DUF1043 family)